MGIQIKSLDKHGFLCYIILMKKNNLPYIRKIQDLNDEFNKAFRDEVFMPMVKFAVTLMTFTVMLDYSFQMVEAINWLTLGN